MTAPARPWLPLFVCVASALAVAGCGDDGGSGDDEVSGDGSGSDVAWCDAVSDWDDEATAFENDVVVLVNQNRAAGANCGGEDFAPTGTVSMEPALRCAARRHSLDMVTRDYFDHNTPEGVTPWDRIEMAEYDASGIGENIAAGQSSPEQVVESWMGSTGHCKNIMNPDADEIGVGYLATDQAQFSGYWTQVFGSR